MSWARLDDGFPWHPKILGLTDGAFRLYVSGLCYASRYRTDGIIPGHATNILHAEATALSELFASGLWYEANGEYEIHDFHDYQPTAEETEERRQKLSAVRAEAGRIGGIVSGEHRRNKATKQTGSTNEATERSPVPSRPVPSNEEGIPAAQEQRRAGGFLEFWTVYPRKVGKGKALSVWTRMSSEDRAAAIASVPKFAAAWKGATPDRTRFIPHPSTWLGQQRYHDDPAEWSRQAAPEPVPSMPQARTGASFPKSAALIERESLDEEAERVRATRRAEQRARDFEQRLMSEIGKDGDE